MAINGLDHINIDTADPEATIAFYELLGLTNRPELRPDFGFPGAWLFSGERAVVHLNFLDVPKATETGAFNHVAFEAVDFDGLCELLDANDLAYRTSIRDEIGLRQVFVGDPNGVRVELNVRGSQPHM